MQATLITTRANRTHFHPQHADEALCGRAARDDESVMRGNLYPDEIDASQLPALPQQVG